jgi:imidazoleglycerol-phosphate dehydratase
MRYAEINRKTAETDIVLTLNLDGSGNAQVKTGCGFLDHMLTLLAKHSRFDLTVTCQGDTWVDDHHSVEDVGIALGQAFTQALGEKKGINRYGDTYLPMDEALVLSAVDISGRAYLSYELPLPSQKIGNFDTELIEEFFLAFVRNAMVTLHIRRIEGRNSHHIAEAAFKSVGRTLKEAVAIDPAFADDVPSTKGVL